MYNLQNFKNYLKMEYYLTTLNYKERIILTKFRCGNTMLPIISGRYSNISRNERNCILCTSGNLGDEYHYLFSCQYFENERTCYIDQYFLNNPTVYKMYELFNSKKISTLSHLSKFCYIIMEKFK